jgi:hypothetical protein
LLQDPYPLGVGEPDLPVAEGLEQAVENTAAVVDMAIERRAEAVHEADRPEAPEMFCRIY